MKKKRKASHNRRVTYMLLALAVLMLLGSAVGSTRAALTYYSENYTAEITVSQIGVTLLENGKEVSRRDYKKDDWEQETNAGKDAASGALLQEMVPEGEEFVLNKTYEEKLAVRNSGSIDEYVRVRIYKYWTDQEGKKETSLSPDMIDLHLANTDRWVQGKTNSAECTELYYKGILPAGEETKLFADTIRVDGKLAESVKIEEDEKHVITMTYEYDGVKFHVEVEVDAVQTHNAQDAIRSAWGVDASALGIL
ncbi:MAG: hypothetical protein HFH12_13090 [Dorea sp.]|nr:hypothetical protein [Dorea sp.]